MSDALRQLSEQTANTIAAREQQIADARANIETWEKELEELKDAKSHIDSKLPKLPTAAPAS
jgi:ubiquinone biosynthesis protein UbiJ